MAVLMNRPGFYDYDDSAASAVVADDSGETLQHSPKFNGDFTPKDLAFL